MKIVLNSHVTYTKVPSQPLFHRIFDGEKYWGINFIEPIVAEKFLCAVKDVLTAFENTQKHSSLNLGNGTTRSNMPRPASAKVPLKALSKNPPPIPKLTSTLSTPPIVSTPNGTLRTPTPKGVSKPNAPFLKSNVKSPMKTPPQNVKLPTSQPKNFMITPKSNPKRFESKGLSTSLPSISSFSMKTTPNIHSPPPIGIKDIRSNSMQIDGQLSSLHNLSPPSSSSDKSIREKIVDEILKTETDYVDSLNILRDMYYLPLKYAPRMGVSIFKPGDFEKMFYGLDTILLLNKEFLIELKIKKSSGLLYKQCGKVFNLFVPSMKLYIDYVNKYDNTLKLIKEYEEHNDAFRKLLQSNMEDIDCHLRGIQDFLIMPVQRIPRYVLLLQELKNKTDETHEDYIEILKALQSIESIAGYINTQKKDYEDKAKVTLIQQRLNPKGEPLLKEGRLLIWEGVVYIKNPTFVPPKKPIKKKPNKDPSPDALGLMEIEVFLLNDLIFWAEKESKHGYLNELRRIDLWDIRCCEETEPYSVPFYPIDQGKFRSVRIISPVDPYIPPLYVENSVIHSKLMSLLTQEVKEATQKKAEELNRKAKAK